MNNFFPLLVDIVKMPYDTLNKFLVSKLTAYYPTDKITYHDEADSSFIYVQGNDPYMLVAHTDTVHKDVVTEILITKSLSNVLYSTISSPQGIGGDDRNGIVIIFALLDAGFRPSLLFPSGEEIGGRGSTRFTESYPTLSNINFFLQFDRRNNNDVTRYADDNDLLIKEIIKFGYTEVDGSFSDISILCPKYGISGVNVSASFFNEHTLHEHTDIHGLRLTINAMEKFLKSDAVNKSYAYKAKTYKSYAYEQTSLFPAYDKTYSFNSLKAKSKVKDVDYDLSSSICSVCGLYGTQMFPLADALHDEHICEVCLSKSPVPYYGCLHCAGINYLDKFTAFTVDFNKREILVECELCMEAAPIHDSFSHDLLNELSDILSNPYKKVK